MHKGTILYVGGFELPDKNAAAHRVLNNAKVFRELGYRVVFCGVDKSITTQTQGEVFDVAGFDSIPQPYLISKVQWLKQMLHGKNYLDIFEKYKDIQLVIGYNLHAVQLAKLMTYCKKNKVKIITDCTEWYEIPWSISPIKMLKKLDMFLATRWLQPKCDGMIAISSYLKKNFEKKMENIIVVPPLVDIEDDKFRKESVINNEVPTLVYSGNPCVSKESLGDVVKSLQNIQDIDYKFKVVGINAEQFEDMYHISPNQEHLEFLGRVSHLEALRQVKESDYAIIIRPKVRRTMAGFPTKFAEAISCGTAVIANATSDLERYLSHGQNGFLVNETKLEEELREILTATEKPIVKKETFDYRTWKDTFQAFLEHLEIKG